MLVLAISVHKQINKQTNKQTNKQRTIVIRNVDNLTTSQFCIHYLAYVY